MTYSSLVFIGFAVSCASGCGAEQTIQIDRSPVAPTTRPAPKEFRVMKMNDFAWTRRPLVIFADALSQPALAVQQQIIEANLAGLVDRDMVVVKVIGDDVTVDNEPRQANAAALRSAYGIEPSDAFAVMLVGKDTGVKLRRDEPVAMDEVFSLIDSMPMRRQEMGDASR